MENKPWKYHVMNIYKAYPDPMYCQSKEMLRRPNPSFPSVPPNKFVKTSLVLEDAF